jgi:hypothetical protein
MCYHIIVHGDNMGNMTLSIPDDIQNEMKQFSEIRWSEVARKAIIAKLEALKTVERIVRKSKLTKEDADEIDRLVKRGASRRYDNH